MKGRPRALRRPRHRVASAFDEVGARLLVVTVA
jgi:hypothetical protein